MASDLPQLPGELFLTDGGLETTLVFLDGIDLPDFAAFPLLDTTDGRRALRRYFNSYIDVAARDGAGIVLETPTWRASADWGYRLGFSEEDLDRINRAAVALLRDLARADAPTIVVSGNLGPRHDAYSSTKVASVAEATEYHRPQIASFAGAGADLVTALTLTHIEEAIGIVIAAQQLGIEVVISFTVDLQGLLPSGQSLASAITDVDAATDGAAAYFMINCAHPSHFLDTLRTNGPWHRVRGIRANASRSSHDELDNADELDRGDEVALAADYLSLSAVLPNLAVVGGCCGTDHHHIGAISAALRPHDRN